MRGYACLLYPWQQHTTQEDMMADSGPKEVAVIGNTDLTSAELDNNIKNTV